MEESYSDFAPPRNLISFQQNHLAFPGTDGAVHRICGGSALGFLEPSQDLSQFLNAETGQKVVFVWLRP